MGKSPYKNILLTGASGQLGQGIVNSGIFPRLLTPGLEDFDITKPPILAQYFAQHEFDAVIHCAALARIVGCEKNPVQAIETNIVGTSHLVNAVLDKENQQKKKIRFVHISTDGVYPCTRGRYREEDETIPYSKYGWTKLGAECAVNLLSDFCIIRTNFFDPSKQRFASSATDLFTSKVPVNYLVNAIRILLFSGYIGVINVGGKRQSDYARYKPHNPSLKPCRRVSIVREIHTPLAEDASLNIQRWKKIERMGTK